MAPCNILIVEDDETLAALLEARLEKMGHQVAARVSTGEEAVTEAGETMPDLVLMDILLGGEMDGIEAAGHIQSRFRIPVIYLTAYSDPGLLKRAKITEPFGYLTKPISQAALRGGIEIALYKSAMERRLRESEERLELALEGGNLGAWDWNLQTGKTVWDRRALEAFGYSVGDIKPLFRTWKSLSHSEDWPYVLEKLNEHFVGESPYLDVQYRFRSKSGDWRWMLMHGKVVERDKDGKSVRITGTCRDVTNQVQAEEALRASEQRFRDLARLLPEPVFELDKEGVATFANQAALDLLGYTQEDLEKGIMASQILAPDDRNTGLENMQKVLSGKEMGGNELLGLRKDGTTFPIWFHTTRIITHNRVVGLRGIGIDLTELRRTEQALRESEDRLKDFLESANDLIQMVDADGRLVFANQAWRETLGYSENEIQGLSFFDFVHQDSTSKFKEAFQRVVSGGTISNLEAVFVTKEGRPVVVEGNINCRFKDGKPVNTRGIFRDVTDRKKAEDALNFAYRRLDEYSTLLENRVYERTVELEESRQEIKEYAGRLEIYSEGLAIVLRSVQTEKRDLEDKVTQNCNSVLRPILDQLRVCDSPKKAELLLDSMEFQIEKIASLTGPQLIEQAEVLTPREIQVCLHLKSCLTSKEIATIMGISAKAVSFHRGNIRRKLGLVGTGNDLVSFLMATEVKH